MFLGSNELIYGFHVSIVKLNMTFNEELIDFSNTNERDKEKENLKLSITYFRKYTDELTHIW